MTGAVRLFDPDTSYAAAASITGRTERVILETFRNTDLRITGATDDELCGLLAGHYAPTVKSARSRLARSHKLRDSGIRRPSVRGRDQIVWRLA